MINYNSITNHGIFNISDINNSIASSIEKLSSGRAINHASDDPAGTILSQKMASQIGAIEQKIKNYEMQSSKLSAAGGHIDSLSAKLFDIRDSAVAAANSGSLDKEQVEAIKRAANDSVKAYNEIVKNSSFGRQKLLDGSKGSVADVEEISEIDLSTPEKAAEAIEQIDKISADVNSLQGEVGAHQSQEVESSISNLEQEFQNLSEAESGISDADYAQEYSNLVANQIKLQAATAMLSQGNLKASTLNLMLSNP